MKKVTLITSLLLFLLSSFLSPKNIKAQTTSDWPAFMFDQFHSGFNSTETYGPPFSLSWSYQTGSLHVRSGVVVGQTIYFKTSTTLYALGKSAGNLIWSVPTHSASDSSPTVVNNTVYTEDSSGILTAYDAATGAIDWSTALPSGVGDVNVVNNVVYTGSTDKKVRALDAITGTLLWTSTSLDAGITNVPAVDSGKVFIGGFTGQLYALDALTGTILWKTQPPSNINVCVNSSPTVADNKVYVGNCFGYIYAIDENTGSVVWQSERMTDSIWSTPAIANGNLFGQDLAGRVFALDATTGATKWIYQTGAAPSSSNSSAAVANDVVYIGSSDGYFYALDANSGALLNRYLTDGKVLSSPAISSGVIYEGSNDGKLYAFGLSPVINRFVPPFINSIPSTQVNEGSNYSTTGNFTDSDSSSWTGSVNYGDDSGTQSLTLVGKSFTLNHLYKDNGSYVAKVSITDDQGLIDTAPQNITVNNIDPTIGDFTIPSSINTNTPFTASANFTDPGVLDTHAGTWNFGDGKEFAIINENNGSGTASAEHTYSSPGTYTIDLRLFDNNGGHDEKSVNVTVIEVNVAPVVNSFTGASIDVGDTYSTDGSFTDSDSSNWTANVDYGDGSGVQSLPLLGTNFSLNHTYNVNGNYTVTVNVTDNQGAIGTGTANVTVTTPRQLTALSPAKVWVGLKTSDDVGLKFDLLAEVYKDGSLVTSKELDSVAGGGSGFNNAKLDTISFDSFSPVDFPTSSQLSLKLYVRNACSGSGHNSGTARLWYNDSAANSQFGSTIAGTSYTDYLLNSFVLGTSVGTGPKQTVDVSAGAKCSSFKPFSTWTITP